MKLILTKVNNDVCSKFCENIGEYFYSHGIKADDNKVREKLNNIAGASVLEKVWKNVNVNESTFVKKIKSSCKRAKKSEKKGHGSKKNSARS